MADAAEITPSPPRRMMKSLVAGLILALAGGGAGYGVVHLGLLDGFEPGLPGFGSDAGPANPAFMELAPFLVTLGPVGDGRILRFAATLEIDPDRRDEVAQLMPRLADVLNSYLRAIAPEEFGMPGALIRLRAQMLRRVQVVTGDGRVRDLLVTEFVVN